jgi:hypothetical protein
MTSTGMAMDGCHKIIPFSLDYGKILHRLLLQVYATVLPLNFKITRPENLLLDEYYIAP